MTGRTPERAVAHTTLQKLLSRFHFGITLFAVALSGATILLAGVTTLRGYADRNMELAARLGAYGVEPALVFNDPQAAREGLAPLTRLPGIDIDEQTIVSSEGALELERVPELRFVVPEAVSA